MEENTVMANEVQTETEKPSKWTAFKAKVKKPAIIAGALIGLGVAYSKGKKSGYDDGYDRGYADAEHDKETEEPEENEEEE